MKKYFLITSLVLINTADVSYASSGGVNYITCDSSINMFHPINQTMNDKSSYMLNYDSAKVYEYVNDTNSYEELCSSDDYRSRCEFSEGSVVVVNNVESSDVDSSAPSTKSTLYFDLNRITGHIVGGYKQYAGNEIVQSYSFEGDCVKGEDMSLRKPMF